LRSLTPRTLTTATFVAFLAAVPLASAYAAGHKGAASISDPRLVNLIDQVQGVDKGIADARQAKTITPAQAQSLHMRAAHISQAAERTAVHGTLQDAQYHQLMRQLDDLGQTLMKATGSAFDFGDGSDGGHYPNG
jgi:hypothetical protein